MYCHEAFRCPREDCPVRLRRLRRCWEYFKAKGIPVSQDVCPFSPCNRCHYHMGWEIGLIGESLFSESELPDDPREEITPTAKPTEAAETPSHLSPPTIEASTPEKTSTLPPFPPEASKALPHSSTPSQAPSETEKTAQPDSSPHASPETISAATLIPTVPNTIKDQSDDQDEVLSPGGGREPPEEILPTAEEIMPAPVSVVVSDEALPLLPSLESKPPSDAAKKVEAVGTFGNRFCWEVMKCENKLCPVRQRQIIRCFGFFGPRSQEEKDRLCGCQRLCSECHYHRGWELGIIHDGLFEDLLEERRKRMARAHSIQQKGIVEIYLQELSRKPFSRAEEVILAKRLAGDKQAAELLLTANLKLVVRISSQFSNRGLNLMDLIQEGNLGLIKAISKFDWRLGYKFSTYAAYWVRHYMQRAVSNQGRVVRVPHHLLMVAHKIKRAIGEFQGQWQRSPNLTELSQLMGLEEEKVLDIIRITETPVSIEARQHEGNEEDASLEYYLADKNRLTPEEEMLEKAKAEACVEALKKLPERLRDIVEYFYGFRDEELSLAELGRRKGISRERVRQLLQEALAKLGEGEFVAHLKDFL